METRNCQRCKNSFVLDKDDFSFYEKMKVPAPKVCPDCRFKMRAMWRNEMSLYSGRKCGLCGKMILSMYSLSSKYKVYCYECFYSDKWNPESYGKKYHIDEQFFKQLGELLENVPRINLGISSGDGPNINSEYLNMASSCKNCYLIFNGGINEDSMYMRGVRNSFFSLDCYFAENLERCYESINTQKSSGILWGHNVVGCIDSAFILNGSGLNNCFGCVNLRNKSNCWFNEQLTPEEYRKRLDEVMGSYDKLEKVKKEFYNLCLKYPHRENNNIKIVDSNGDYLTECKSVKNSFEVTSAENCSNLFSSKFLKDSLGTIGYGTKSELLLEVVATGHSSNIIGSYWAENCSNIMYSFDLRNCNDCIGCDGLKNAQYCILNKQYSKEEYEKLKDHIIKELTDLGIHGLMMPPEIAPFAYNETIAQDNMPLTKEEAIAQGFRWEDDIQMTKGKATLQPEEIPDHINDVKNTITSEILKCIECTRNYKITEQELLFYRKMVLPIPRKCFFCRHKDRIERRGPYKFWDRKCDNCGKDIKTNYAPNRPEKVYCEACYKAEIF